MFLMRPGMAAVAIAPEKPVRAGGMLRSVQFLRTAAALLVVSAHLDIVLSAIGVFPQGQAAVGIFGAALAIFFTISGFVMVYTTRNSRLTPWTFMANRIVRAVPFYWAVTMVVFTIALAAPEMMQATRADPGELLESLTVIPFQKANGLVEPVLFVGWTLNYEMFFYVVFASGLSFANKTVGAVSVILWLSCFVVVGIITQPTGIIARFYTDSIILEFALGMLVALVLPYLPARAGLGLKVVAALLVLVGMGAAIWLPYQLPNAPVVIVCGIPTTLILGGIVALEGWGWAARSSVWLVLGDATYSIYLTHPFVTQVVGKIARRLDAHGPLAIALLVFALASSCVVGVVVYRTVERPLWQLARRALTPRQIKPRTALS